MSWDQPSSSEDLKAQWGAVVESYPSIDQLRIDALDRKIDSSQFHVQLERWESKFPAWSRESLSALGVPEFAVTVDRARTDGFRKEGRLQTQEHEFLVVDDEQGVPWLLKFNPRWARSSVTNMERYESVRGMQQEEFAYRLAQRIRYPMAETKFVQYNGQPCVAYRFIDDAKEWSRFEAGYESGETVVGNAAAPMARPLVNVLWGATEDRAFQGILDPGNGNAYSAQDVGIAYTAEEMKRTDPEFVADTTAKLLKSRHGGSLYYGPLPKDSAPLRDLLRNFFAGLGKITPDVAEQIFEGFIGTPEEQSATQRELVRRARLLSAVYDAAREGKI